MRALKWIAGIAAFVIVEVFVLVGWLYTGLAENCDNGIDRWECNATLEQLFNAAFFLVPGVAVLAALVAIKRRRDARAAEEAGPLS